MDHQLFFLNKNIIITSNKSMWGITERPCKKNISSTRAYPTNPNWIRIKKRIQVGRCI